MPLSQCNIQPDSTLYYLTPSSEDRLTTIYIKDLCGKTVAVEISLSATVLQVALQIEKKLGIPVDSQRLIFAGKQLQMELTLADYNIPNESSLYLVLRLKGG